MSFVSMSGLEDLAINRGKRSRRFVMTFVCDGGNVKSEGDVCRAKIDVMKQFNDD